MAHPTDEVAQKVAENPEGVFSVISAWTTAFAHFAWENIGLTLFVGWCITLFLFTNFSKNWIRRIVKDREDSELVVASMPSFLGAAMGWWVFPAIVSMTSFGITVHGFFGILAGMAAGQLTKGAVDLSRHKKFRRWCEVIFKRTYNRIPFLPKLTVEEQKFIDTTTSGVDVGELHELQGIVEQLKKLGNVTINEDGHVIFEPRVVKELPDE